MSDPSDPETVRKNWARRVTDEYDGWPSWAAPDAPAGPRTGEPVTDAATGADAEGGRTASGWSWDVPSDDLEGVDLQLMLRQHTGQTAQALRDERAYWGLDRGADD